MNASLRQLRAFVAVATSGSFSRAADTLALTQPAVSRNVTELEQALGLQLLHRTTREVELTEAGRLLLGNVTRVLEDLDACLLEVQGLATQRKGRVKVASSPTLSAHLLPQCIARGRQLSPDVNIQLLDRIQSDVLLSVRSGEVDFGVVIDPSEKQDLHAQAILSEPFCLVCLSSDRLARKKEVHWAELAGQPLVLLDHASGSRRLIDAALQSHGAAAPVVQDVGHTTTIYSMVEQGLGLSVVPQLAIPNDWKKRAATPAKAASEAVLVSRKLVPQVQRSIMLVRRQQRELSPVAHGVWDLIADEARQRLEP
ncbi:LysR family transcriptional regulator [Comamonas sp. Y6]|uniref:LysR family transcriptional regulator n=1 Tax=Comamonas resistens TaxID=3046670 RepID=A0ABY8SL37_9BURK|nr:LysR family transcriptional regulator [Comamonas resistens]MDL5039117.1 LysR family transcriptional regulator [Comamonas resistens]WHS63787.1 LysR family transcriptional regulator [Comamonas resistens]